MLNTPAPFPHVGATAFIAPDGTAARILRRNRDGSALVALQPGAGDTAFGARLLRTVASGNRTVPADELFASAAEALGLPAPGPAITGEAIPRAPLHQRARRRTARARSAAS